MISIKNFCFGAHNLRRGLLLSGLFACAIWIVSCATQSVDPLTLEITQLDKEESQFPPVEDDLLVSPHLLLSLVTYKDPTVTEPRLTAITNFLHHGLERYANFSTIPITKVAELMSAEENRRFQPGNVADAIALGNQLNAAFVAQLQIQIVSSKIVKSIDHYTANTNMTVFTTDSGQVVFKQDLVFDTFDTEASEKALRLLVQEYFPLRAYILETRGDRQYAKISIGRSLGVKIGREFLVREREVKSEIVMGMNRKTVSFSPLALGTVKVIEVMEDESWVTIEKSSRMQIKKGMVVFSKPEKSNIFL